MPVRVCLATYRRCVLLLLVLLSACGTQQPLPSSPPELLLPGQWHVRSEHEGQRRDWLLVLQQEGAGLRFSLFNPLGVPLARQRLIQQQWHADGLLPPFAEARELFAASLFALTPTAQLKDRYPSAENGPPRQLDGRWQIDYQSPERFVIQHNNTRYHFTPLPTEAAL